jgi:hypothetical protein
MDVPILEPSNRVSLQGPAAVPPAGKTIPAVPVTDDLATFPDASGTNDASDSEDNPHAIILSHDPACTLCAHQGVPAARYHGAVAVIEAPQGPTIKYPSPPPGCALLGTARTAVGSEAVGAVGARERNFFCRSGCCTRDGERIRCYIAYSH